MIGTDVIANILISYMAVKPIDDGYELHWVVSIDWAGNLVGMVRSRLNKSLAYAGLYLTNYVMHGTLPSSE